MAMRRTRPPQPLAPHGIPGHLVEFVEELPKTVTGKIQRFKLREPETGVRMPQQEDELV